MKTNTKLLFPIGLCLLLLAGVINLMADALPQPRTLSAFAGNGYALNLGTNYVVIPAESAEGKTPVLTYVNTTTFNGSGSAATLQAFYSTNGTFASATNTGLLTTNFVNSTNNAVAGNWMVIHHINSGLPVGYQDEALIVSAVQNTNQIVTQTAAQYGSNPGDVIWFYAAGASIKQGNTSSGSQTIGPGGGIISGLPSQPMLLVSSTAGLGTNTINCANADFR